MERAALGQASRTAHKSKSPGLGKNKKILSVSLLLLFYSTFNSTSRRIGTNTPDRDGYPPEFNYIAALGGYIDIEILGTARVSTRTEQHNYGWEAVPTGIPFVGLGPYIEERRW